MRTRVIGAVAALASLALSVLPSIGGQHFGIVSGDTLTFGSVGAAFAGPTCGGAICASGFFTVGALADVVDSGAAGTGPNPSASLATLEGCILLETTAGTDFGCVRDLRIPSLPDPLMDRMTIEVAVPSKTFPRTVIRATLSFAANGAAAPSVSPDATPPNYPDFKVTLSAGLSRPGVVGGFAQSEGLRTGGELSPATMGTLTRGATVLACSYQGVVC